MFAAVLPADELSATRSGRRLLVYREKGLAILCSDATYAADGDAERAVSEYCSLYVAANKSRRDRVFM